MTVHTFDPLTDSRWPEFVAAHPSASAFHTRGWLQALHDTYGYHPVAYTTTPPGHDLADAIPFCHVSSWLTGRRLVSIPFSDHCQPLVTEPSAFRSILTQVGADAQGGRRHFAELRPAAHDLLPIDIHSEMPDFALASQYFLHKLDLTGAPEQIFAGFHKNCVQRAIRRSEREQVTVETGTSRGILAKFYHLLFITRRRHRLPPQPIKWFTNLLHCMDGNAIIRVASSNETPVAAILTLHHGQTVIYKYGCSDERHYNLGGIFALFWQMIREARDSGATTLDLGRSDMDNPGLVQFKDRWGATRTEISYFRSPPPVVTNAKSSGRAMALANAIFARLPDPLLILAGRALYRHKG